MTVIRLTKYQNETGRFRHISVQTYNRLMNTSPNLTPSMLWNSYKIKFRALLFSKSLNLSKAGKTVRAKINFKNEILVFKH